MERMNILPVFAGMIRTQQTRGCHSPDSPRIRGDDPVEDGVKITIFKFSPYSRG